MKTHRDDFTVFSGLTQLGNESAGHNGEITFLTGAFHPEQPGFHNSISVDQVVAEQVGIATRFPSLVMGTGGGSISVNRSGVKVPADSKPSKIFAKLFLDGTPDEVRQEMDRLNEGRSILDSVSDDAKRSAAGSAPAIATSSTNISPACARWSSACRRCKPGRASPSPR